MLPVKICFRYWMLADPLADNSSVGKAYVINKIFNMFTF